MTFTPLSSISGRLLRAPQVLTTLSSSYGWPSGTKKIMAYLIGGGGGGGGASASSAQVCTGAAGGAGSFTRVTIDVSANPSVSFSVGAGGGGGVGAFPTQGTSGGTTTLTVGGTNYRAFGGTGGQGGSSVAGLELKTGGSGGSNAGTNGNIAVHGQIGKPSHSSSALNNMSGAGGSTIWGGGGVGNSDIGPSNGASAVGIGGGGAGGTSVNASGATNGGNGSDGIIVIWEYS